MGIIERARRLRRVHAERLNTTPTWFCIPSESVAQSAQEIIDGKGFIPGYGVNNQEAKEYVISQIKGGDLHIFGMPVRIGNLWAVGHG